MSIKSIRLSQSAVHVLRDSGAINATSDLSRVALAAIDPERVSSAVGVVSEFGRVAVARLPVELSGITPEVQARVVGSLVSPSLAAQFAEESAVLEAARTVVQGTIDDVAPLAGWGAGELVEAFGDDWKLPGLTASHATRLAAEQQTAAEAA